MKKKFISFMLAMCLIIPCAFIFTACGEDKHEHTYSTEWSSDATYHWHQATCEHTEEISGKDEHSFGNVIVDTQPTGTTKGSGHKICSVCGKSVTTDIASWSPKGKSFAFSKYVIGAKDSTAEDWIKAKADEGKSAMTNEQFATWLVGNYNDSLSANSTFTFNADSLIVTQSVTIGNETNSQNKNYTIDGNIITFGESVHIYIINADTIRLEQQTYGVEDNEKIVLYSQYVVEGGTEASSDPIPNPIHEHNYGTWIAEVAATCTTAGTKGHYHCAGCNKDFDASHNELSSLAISATGHTYSDDWSKNATKHWHAATCEHTTGKKDEADHTYNYKGVCTTCNYDNCSTLSLGYTFDDDNSKGTENAEQNTKWYTKVSLTSGTAYMASCTNINKYTIKIFDNNGTELYEFGSESNSFYKFNATYTGDYYISILKSGSGNYKPIFYIASIQNMTSPFDSESANNSATYAAKEFKAFSFTIDADCSIKLNGAFGEDDCEEFISSNMESIYMTSWDEVNNFQVVEDLPAGTYYFVDYQATAGTTVNYYLVCGHNFDDGVCDVCGHECSHSNLNAYGICDECGLFMGNDKVVVNGGSYYPSFDDNGNAYIKYTLTAGTYQLIEELGEDCTGFNYYLFEEGAENTDYTDITSLKTFTITEAGVYYLAIEDTNNEDGSNSFQLLENITSALIANGSYTATSITNNETYYYVIDITNNGVYTFTYDDDIDGDVVSISIIDETKIDGITGTDYKLDAGRYILKVDVTTADNDNISINCGYSQCVNTDGSLTTGLTVAHGKKVYFQINLEEGDYSVRTGSTLDLCVVFKSGGVIVGSLDNFSIDENLGAGTYYVVAYNAGTDTKTGAFGIQ